MSRLLFVTIMLAAAPAQAMGADLADCARLHNDDTIHGYVPALHDGLARAFGRLFPSAPNPPDERAIEAGAHIRCMDGRLLACFTGANLPCEKMSTARDNPGAVAFCRANPEADAVPAFATGHDTIYGYRCRSGRPDITGTVFPLDRRGFAAELWAPLD
jgi:hypothetical protein